MASWPAVGQVVTAAPDRVTFEFTTEVLPDVVIAVVDPAGTSLADGDPVVRGPYVTQALRTTGVPGPYNASIHVIGVDQHPIVTRVDFMVDPNGVATVNPAGAPPDLGTDPGADVSDGPASDDQDHTALWALGVGLSSVVLVVAVRLAARRRTAA